MEETLLDRAKSIGRKPRTRRVINGETIATAIAWLEGEIEVSQITWAMGVANKDISYRLICRSLRQAYEDGKLMIRPGYETPVEKRKI